MARRSEGLSLRTVAERADISAAYLQKLESDRVQSPSPHVLQRIAEVLRVSYGRLMQRAGYLLPAASREPGVTPLQARLADSSLSDAEERAVAAFIEHLLSERRPTASPKQR